MIITAEDYLAHYGILRKSGRYPWGSGTPEETMLSGGILDITRKLRKEGLTDPEIARGLGMTTTQLRAARSIEGNRVKQEKIRQAQTLRDRGHGASAIGERMGLNESSVRSLLAEGAKDKADNLQTIASMLKDDLDTHGGFIDVGAGVENRLGISATKLKTAVAILEEKGYKKFPAQIDQVGTAAGQKTTTKVLAPPGTTYQHVKANRDQIRLINGHFEDGGRTAVKVKPPLNIHPDRVGVNYKENGGDKADGVIFVRRGVEDVSIGGNAYAQVRIAVGGTHYLKGMAVYKDDLPKGIDLQFNTNKSNTGNKFDAMKPMQKKANGKVDLENPFTSQIRRQILDDNGKPKSVMNILDEEGTWENWNKAISTQVLSKQKPQLAKQQLDLTYERKKTDLAEIKSLTNPAVRRKLLEAFADGADSSAVHLSAAHLPRQGTHVILPIPSLKESEVYAPRYKNGEIVALIRYPHGGKFEIPELVVNNGNREARGLLGKDAPDAIGIHPKVAHRLSGADFDGDTVVVIPNSHGHIHSEPALKDLKGFDPQAQFKPYHGMKTIDGGTWNEKTKSVDYHGKTPSSRAKGTQMGMVSNLITDMTIKGASNEELARAVKHSMVVIDAEKHSLDYKASAQQHGIQQLYKKYQSRDDGRAGGASTLISRATSKRIVDATKPRSAKEGGPIDPATGRLMTVPHTYVDRQGNTVTKKTRVEKLAATEDAHTLVSKENTKIENVYADHSNRLKALANDARKEVAAFKPPLISKSAKTAYKSDVDSLNAKLNLARRNKPLERQAQIFANSVVAKKVEANPLMDPADLKKIKSQALETARARTGAQKHKIIPSPSEWAAIQAGAVSQNQLKQILDNADLDAIRALATPRTHILMTPTKTSRAKAMLNDGYTLQEVADQLGVSRTTVETSIQ